MPYYTLQEVRQNLSTVASSTEAISKFELLKLNITLVRWVFSQSEGFFKKLIKTRDIKLIRPFFRLCTEFRIRLSKQEKKELFAHCLRS